MSIELLLDQSASEEVEKQRENFLRGSWKSESFQRIGSFGDSFQRIGSFGDSFQRSVAIKKAASIRFVHWTKLLP